MNQFPPGTTEAQKLVILIRKEFLDEQKARLESDQEEYRANNERQQQLSARIQARQEILKGRSP